MLMSGNAAMVVQPPYFSTQPSAIHTNHLDLVMELALARTEMVAFVPTYADAQ